MPYSRFTLLLLFPHGFYTFQTYHLYLLYRERKDFVYIELIGISL